MGNGRSAATDCRYVSACPVVGLGNQTVLLMCQEITGTDKKHTSNGTQSESLTFRGRRILPHPPEHGLAEGAKVALSQNMEGDAEAVHPNGTRCSAYALQSTTVTTHPARHLRRTTDDYRVPAFFEEKRMSRGFRRCTERVWQKLDDFGGAVFVGQRGAFSTHEEGDVEDGRNALNLHSG